MDIKYNLVEFFSGIGSQAKALKNLGIQVNILGTSEWDVHAIAAYDIIHNSPEMPEPIQQMSKDELLEILSKYTFSNSGKTALDFSSFRTYSVDALRRIYTSIIRNHNFVDISELPGEKIPGDADILTYSFPCQDLSNVGAFHGYNKGIDKDSGSRSSLLWQVGRILAEMNEKGNQLPRFLLMENVPTLLSERHLENFKTWLGDLKELGYVSQYYQLNASSFGLPQNRPRLLMISVYVGNNEHEKKLISDYFNYTDASKVVSDYQSSKYYKPVTVSELLRINYNNKKIMAEAIDCTPNDTPSRRRIWEENPQIILPDGSFNEAIDVVRTITTKQDRNPNSGNLYFDSGIEGRSKFRYLTPRECLLFMGFTDDDYKRLKKNNIEFHKGDAFFARDKIIRMAGNSIPVKLLEGVFLQIMQIDSLLFESRKHSNMFGGPTDTDMYIARIKSAMFDRGIRSRGAETAPVRAQIVYPKYKTAVFIQRCFWDGHTCKDSSLPEVNQSFWEYLVFEERRNNKAKYDEISALGWNVLIIWECALQGELAEITYDKIANALKRNVKSKKSIGEEMYIG